MAPSNPRKTGRAAASGALGVLFVMAVATGGLATWQGYRLSLAHDLWEVRQSQSADVFGTWLSQLSWASEPATLHQNRDLISLRLRLLSLSDRRQTVLALAKPDFLPRLGLNAVQSANARATVLDAVREALSKAPSLADLWYLNAKLMVDSGVYDEQVLKSYKLSYLLGPREVELVLGRVLMGQSLWAELDEEARQIVATDYALLAQVFPDQAEAVLEELKEGGADLGQSIPAPAQN